MTAPTHLALYCLQIPQFCLCLFDGTSAVQQPTFMVQDFLIWQMDSFSHVAIQPEVAGHAPATGSRCWGVPVVTETTSDLGHVGLQRQNL